MAGVFCELINRLEPGPTVMALLMMGGSAAPSASQVTC